MSLSERNSYKFISDFRDVEVSLMTEISDLINSINPDLIKRILVDLVKTPSENPPGSTSDIVHYLHTTAQELGFSSEIITAGPGGRENHVASIGDSTRSIILCGHLDTVPAGDVDSWKFPPYGGHEKDGFVYGRGAADMKAGVAAFLGAMASLNENKVPLLHKIVFTGTAEEETTMIGAKALLKAGIMDHADFLFIGEPTSLQVGIAEKGVIWLILEVRGKAAHGSMPELGVNAIEGACAAIPILKKLVPLDKSELLGQSTLNIGIINGGSKINVVPEICTLECDFRLIPGVDADKLATSILDSLKNLDNMNPCIFSSTFSSKLPALYASPDHAVIKNLMKWTSNLSNASSSPIGLTYGTDAAILAPATQVPFAIFGPGDPSMAHQTNEKVSVEEVVQAAKTIVATIAEFSQK